MYSYVTTGNQETFSEHSSKLRGCVKSSTTGKLYLNSTLIFEKFFLTGFLFGRLSLRILCCKRKQDSTLPHGNLHIVRVYVDFTHSICSISFGLF